MSKRALELVEIDISRCTLTYGSAPCTASIPTTGSDKCFNSLGTCQDRAHFTEEEITLRFAVPTSTLPVAFDARPSVRAIDYAPGSLSLGKSLGERSTLTVVFEDGPRADTGPDGDKYLADRAYDPWRQGTYWGKFRVRNPYLRGRGMRYISGQVGQPLAEMMTRHFVIDSFTGPTRGPGAQFSIVGKDVLKLADGDRAQAPALNTGRLNADITFNTTSATLTPAGIGNAEYAASGYLNLSGTEIVAFTRAADALTLTRAQFSTTAVAHKAGDRAQECLYFNGVSPATILNALFTTYGGIDASYIDLTAWQAEIDAYLGVVYTTLIVEPTGVDQLVDEVIEQAGLVVWPDDTGPALRMQVLRPIAASATHYTPANTIEGSLQIDDQPEKRLSQVHVYFALRNPLLRLDDPQSFLSAEAVVDLQAETDYGSAGIYKIYSRWIPAGGRAIATRLGQLQLGRFVNPPRRVTFSVMAPDFSDGPVALPLSLGGANNIEADPLQDALGAPAAMPVQITRLKPGPAVWTAEAEEVSFTEYDDAASLIHTIILDGLGYFGVNLKTVHDALYGALTAGDVSDGVTVVCIIQAGAIVGSLSTATPALDIGTGWPGGADITVQVLGRLQGCGGAGGIQAGTGDGQAGGNALKTTVAIDLVDATGEIFGGGGGGAYLGANGGGGGAGHTPGAGGVRSGTGINGQPGTTEAGGASASGLNDGGGPGLAGTTTAFVGGAAGKAINGISHVTTIGSPGDRRGGTV